MTTIAYKDGYLAADTQGTWNDQPHYQQLKIFKTKRFLIGFSGRFFNAIPMLNWIKNQPEDRHPMDFWKAEDEPHLVQADQMSALLIDRLGEKFVMNDTGHANRIATHRPYDAMGSGGDYALGAMAHGATAIEAVKVGIDHDIGSGGAVAFLTFDHPNTDYTKGLTAMASDGMSISIIG